MWWFLKKIEDSELSVVYSYGCQTQETSGRIRYDRATQNISCSVLAQDDTNKGVSVLLNHIWKIVNTEGAPDTRTVAIG